MRFSEEFIEDVRAGNDIVDVISGYVQIRHKGSSYMGLCPFHSEKTPSFSINRSRQMYHCFGCGKSGDVFSFIMEYEKNDFNEAVESLAKRAGLQIPENDAAPEKRAERSLREKLLDIHKEAATFYYCNLHSRDGETALAYLRKRGLGDETIKRFGLGYAGKTGQKLYKYLKEKGFTDALLKESGIFSIDEKNSVFRDKFWNRVMFPIMDQNRKVIGFGGRVLGDGQPKYLNSPETKIFEKSRNLYGLYEAKSTRKDYMIVCEGYMDVIALHSAGFTNAVASLGTALTSQHAALIHRYVKKVILLYDSDGAGVKAARRAIPLLRDAGISPRSADMRPYKDPDEFIKACGAEEMEKRLENAENGFMYEVRQVRNEFDLTDPQGQADFQNRAASMLLEFPDEIERNSYLESVSRTYNIDRELLRRQVAKLAMKGRTVKRDEEPVRLTVGKEKNSSDTRTERMLLSWMSRDKKLLQFFEKYTSKDDFTDELDKKIYEILLEQMHAGSFNPASVLNRFEEAEDKSSAAAVLEGAELPEDENARQVAALELLTTLKNRTFNRALENMDVTNPAEVQKFVEEKRKLEELKNGNFSIGG